MSRKEEGEGVKMEIENNDEERRNKRRGREKEIVRKEKREDEKVEKGEKEEIEMKRKEGEKKVKKKSMVGLGKEDLKRGKGVIKRGERWRESEEIIERKGDMVGERIGEKGWKSEKEKLRKKIERNIGWRIEVFKVVDEMRKILNRVDVMVRRRRNEEKKRSGVEGIGDGRIEIVKRKMEELEGIWEMRKIDMDKIGIEEILSSKKEKERGKMIDWRELRVRSEIRKRVEKIRIIEEIEGVRIEENGVNREGKSGMRIYGDREEGNGEGWEKIEDISWRIKIIDGKGIKEKLIGKEDIEKEENGIGMRRIGVENNSILGESVWIGSEKRMLKIWKRIRRKNMRIEENKIGILEEELERVKKKGIIEERIGVKEKGLLRDIVEKKELDGSGGEEEEIVKEISNEEERIENMREEIGMIGRDKNIGNEIEDEIENRIDVEIEKLMIVELRRKLEEEMNVEKSVEGEIGIDRLGEIEWEEGKMMKLERIERLKKKKERGEKKIEDKVMVKGRSRKKGRDRNKVRKEMEVGEDEDVIEEMKGWLREVEKKIDGEMNKGREIESIIGDVESIGIEEVLSVEDRKDILKIEIGKDGMEKLKKIEERGEEKIEDVWKRENEGEEDNKKLIEDRIDRRVSKMWEVMIEIGVKKIRIVGNGRNWSIGENGEDGLMKSGRNRRNKEIGILMSIEEGMMEVEKDKIIEKRKRIERVEVLKNEMSIGKKMIVRVIMRDMRIDLIIGDDEELLNVDKKNEERMKKKINEDIFLIERKEEWLRRKNEEIVLSKDIEWRKKEVEVKNREDMEEIGEGERGREIKRINEWWMILVEREEIIRNKIVERKWLRDKNNNGMWKDVEEMMKELERIVEKGSIRMEIIGNWKEIGNIVEEKLDIERRMERRNKVEIEEKSVDLEVMGENEVGVGKKKGRKGVGGKKMVKKRKRDLKEGVFKVKIIREEMIGKENEIIEKSEGRNGKEIEKIIVEVIIMIDEVGDEIEKKEKEEIEIVVGLKNRDEKDEEMNMERIGGRDMRRIGKRRIIERKLEEEDEGMELGGDKLNEDILRMGEKIRVERNENIEEEIVKRMRKVYEMKRNLIEKEEIWNMKKNERKVENKRIGEERKKMGEVLKNIKEVLKEKMWFNEINMGDEEEEERIMIVERIIKELRRRKKRRIGF